MRVERVEDTLKVRFDTRRALVALFWRLREKLQDDLRKRRGHVAAPEIWRHRQLRDVTMHPAHRVTRLEGQRADKHLVERYTERVQIAARIDGAIHPAGLLRRHIRQGSGDHIRRIGKLTITRQARDQAETG